MRFRRFACALTLGLGLALGPSRSSLGSPPVPSGPRAFIVDGALTPKTGGPVDDATAVASARDALRVHLGWTAAFAFDLDLVELRDDGSRVVRLRQSIAGLPVEGRGARVLVDVDGVARIASAIVDDRAAVATIAKLDAIGAATLAARGLPFPFGDAYARLALLPRPDGLHLAWLVYADVPFTVPYRPAAWVDAVSGARLHLFDRVRSAKLVRTYPSNPAVSKLTNVAIAALPDGATNLTSPTVVARSCVDRKTVKSIDGFGGGPLSMHTCDLIAVAKADVSGDFLSAPVEGATDDVFAEQSAAFHTDRALRYFADVGLVALRPEARPMTVVANVQFPPSFSAGPPSALGCATCKLEPLDNAFYAPAPDSFGGMLYGTKTDALFLGQGKSVDYAYDGDVVYHELGHGVVHSTAKLDFVLHLDDQGAWDTNGALHEGFADYFSSAISGDPHVGEYAGEGLGGGGAIRSIDGFDTCPENVANESHFDSTILSATLWATRASLPDASRRGFDRGVLLALQMLPSTDVDFGTMASVIVKSVAKESSASIAGMLSDEFGKRGVTSCRRIRELDAGGGKSVWPAGWFSFGIAHVGPGAVDADLVPGVMQFHRTLPAGTTRITVDVDVRSLPPFPAWVPGVPWTGSVLVKFDKGPSPMRFTRISGVYKGDFDASRDFDGDSGFVSESFTAPAGSTDVYVMIGAHGEGDGLYDNVAVTPDVTPPRPDAGPPDTSPPRDTGVPRFDAGPRSDATPGPVIPFDEQGPPPLLNGRACSCKVGAGPTTDALSLSLGALGVMAVCLSRSRSRARKSRHQARTIK